MTHLVVIICSKVDGNKRQPHNARTVHCEPNVFGLIKVFRNFSGFECIHRAE